ncbi:MAG: hypothetical protein LBL36_03005 [Clostridiales Family XIII bacterium]|nr:hypothetical protein [Clostridiales Family XIII bacterium]
MSKEKGRDPMKKIWLIRLAIFAFFIFISVGDYLFIERDWRWLCTGIFLSVAVPMTVVQRKSGKGDKRA